MAEPQKSDVPEELERSKETKELDLEKAADQLKEEKSKSELIVVAIGYISFLCILPLVLLKESKFAQFHGKQALVLAIVLYFFDVIEIFPTSYALFYSALKIAIVIYAVFMCLSGKYFKIPFIYSMSEKFSIDIKGKSS